MILTTDHPTAAHPGGGPRPPGSTVCVGVDLHEAFLQVCLLDSEGQELLNTKVENDAQSFLAVIAPYLPVVQVAAESTTGWYWLADLCEDRGIPFRLLDARRAMRARKGRKSDRVDAWHLADLLMRPKPPEVYACPRHLRGPRDLARGWHAVKTERTRAVNRLKAVFRQYAIRLPKGEGQSAIRERLPIFPDEAAQLLAAHHLDTVEHLDERLKCLRRQVRLAAEGTHGVAVRLLRTVPGIGPDLSAAIACEVCDIRRFAGAEKLVGFAGLAVGPNESGGKRYGTNTRATGNLLLKWAFHVVAGQIMRRFPPAQSWVSTRGSEPVKKTRAILAALIARTVYSMLKNHRPFDANWLAATLAKRGSPHPHHLPPSSPRRGATPAV